MDSNERLKHRRTLTRRMQRSSQALAEIRYLSLEAFDDDPVGNTEAMQAWKQLVEVQGDEDIDPEEEGDVNVGEFIIACGYHTIMNWLNERVLNSDLLSED